MTLRLDNLRSEGGLHNIKKVQNVFILSEETELDNLKVHAKVIYFRLLKVFFIEIKKLIFEKPYKKPRITVISCSIMCCHYSLSYYSTEATIFVIVTMSSFYDL